MSEIWSRRNVIATILVGILSCAVTAAFYIFDNRNQEIGTETVETSASSETSLPSVSIDLIHLSEVAMNVPAVLEIGIKVGGNTTLAARNINVSLDFGRAEVQDCGYSPMEAVSKFVHDDKSYRRLEVAELRQEEILYIRCLISTPMFKKIVVEGENISHGRSITFEEYRNRLLSEPIGFWTNLGRVFVVFIFIMLCLKIIGILFPNFN